MGKKIKIIFLTFEWAWLKVVDSNGETILEWTYFKSQPPSNMMSLTNMVDIYYWSDKSYSQWAVTWVPV